jgi:2-polyprenyl-6-methoxyphenol hydroxylase-like FAD-dependent oxidoreductase
MDRMVQASIVGAGPVGLTLANLLTSQEGVTCRIVTDEVTQRPVEQSRAEGNHGRRIALYERLGLLEEAFAQGRPLHGASLHKGDRRLGQMILDDFKSKIGKQKWFSSLLSSQKLSAIAKTNNS